jgi:hypothetical protein
MNVCRVVIFLLLPLLTNIGWANTGPRSGFSLPDTIQEITVRYKNVRNLIVLPMLLNDSIRVNLILDTGCRTLVLFGNRFNKLLQTEPNKVQFSGYGNGSPVFGKVSLYNKISMQQMLGENIPVVIVPNKNMFQNFSSVDGIIGYDILTRFEIEIHPGNQTITFRSAPNSVPPSGYELMDLNVVDCKPVLASTVFTGRKRGQKCELMIDTGSVLSLLFKVKDLDERDFAGVRSEELVGLSGRTRAYQTFSNKVRLNNLELKGLRAGVVSTRHKGGASIGMGVLKNYVIIFNYCKSYMCLKKLNS